MERKESEILAEACGELARGFKKLRGFFLNRSMVRPAGTKSPQNSDTCSVSSGTQTDTGTKSPRDFLTGIGNGAWGNGFLTNALEFSMEGRVRADRFKNYWVADPSYKRGWRAISKPQFLKLFREAQKFMLRCKDLVDCRTKEEYEEKINGKLRETKWRRRHYIVRSELDYVTFREFCRDEHKRLPPLRKGSALKPIKIV